MNETRVAHLLKAIRAETADIDRHAQWIGMLQAEDRPEHAALIAEHQRHLAAAALEREMLRNILARVAPACVGE